MIPSNERFVDTMSEPTGVVGLADAVSELLYGIAGWALVGYGLLIALVGAVAPFASNGIGMESTALAAVMFGLGLTCIFGGLFVNPRFRRRLDRRHGVGDFGHVRSVDQRAIRPDERCLERCVVCDSRVDRGMVRRFRDEYTCFGVPVYTRSVDRNHYCLECALEELQGPNSIDEVGVPEAGEDEEATRAPTDGAWRFPARADPRLGERGDRGGISERDAKREPERERE